MTPRTLPVTLTPLLGFPEVREGDDVAGLVLKVLQLNEIQLIDGDILVVSSKVASKAMGLRAQAGEQAAVVLSQTVRIVAERMTPSGVTRIVESVAGPVLTAAGVDASNTADESIVLLLPRDPDAVAAQIRDRVQTGSLTPAGSHPLTGVILSDTAGRPWRNGQTDFALGAAGIQVLEDLRGSRDADGRILAVTERCIADEIAAAADLVKGKATGVPAAHIRGLGQYVVDSDVLDNDALDSDALDSELPFSESRSGARNLVRTGPQDWFCYGRVEAVRAALGVEPGSTTASEVGVPFISPEDSATRARRALRVALLTCPGGAGEVEGDVIALMAPDDFTLGVLATRTEVALRGEGLTATLTSPPAPAPTRGLGPTPATDEALTSRPNVLVYFQ
jgi:coenzyme F420-0:L-glutamate ligase / coenzyme F420-1:gamma-L-glutamate ligase